ncbi:MAG TPA: type II secretion system F family protein [Anaerolineae bacterium]|nr:type II secretion system F family protein [Anaerolineae bacterium]HOQ98427.1 type II secretion system F family protein [Anaerolineae bacterium]HPL27008.1 type II secretion system F family protein [Anaerolineae bacterium]
MTGMALLIAEGLALAVGLVWVAIEIRRRERQTAQHLQAAVGGPLLAASLELKAPFAERVLLPGVRQLLQRLGALSPSRNIEKLRHELLVAGSPQGLTAMDLLGLRLLTAIAGGLLFGGATAAAHAGGLRIAGGAALGAVLGQMLPGFWLHRRMSRRRRALTLAFPNALDMLTVCVDAGLGLESAFLRISEHWDNDLAHEFRRAVMEIGVGMSWREALHNLAYRTDVAPISSTVVVLLQASQMGYSISDTLHAQADQLRVQRRQQAQELARKAPLKMLFPMVFFIMPAILAVVIGPAIPAVMGVFGG